MYIVNLEVVKIIVPPHPKKDGKWSVTVDAIKWGAPKEKVIIGTETEVKKYQVGYSWME